MRLKVGDRVRIVGDVRSLDLREGDRGVVVKGPMYTGDSLSVHFFKWDRGEGRNWTSGAETHRANGIEAFYILQGNLKLDSCMFKP